MSEPDRGWTPTALISYQSADATTAELLHEELALRGLAVIHDRCSFPTSGRVMDNMAEAVERCDAFVAYLTPAYLYENSPVGSARPAIDNEFKPAIARWRRARATTGPGRKRRPVIVACPDGLGDPRTEAQRRVHAATGENIESLWMPIVIDQSTAGMLPAEAASVAREVLRSLLDPSEPIEDISWPVDLALVTRGTGFHHGLLSIDGTALLGGEIARSGDTADWSRLLRGLRDVEATLSRWPEQRDLRVLARCHLSAALAFGRVFNQAAGWRLTVRGRHGDAQRALASDDGMLRIASDAISPRGDLSVEIDLLGHPVFDVATEAIAAIEIGERLQIWREGFGEIASDEIPTLAATSARSLRGRVGAVRPSVVHVFCSAPVEFALLLGHELTSLHADLQLYERDGASYVPSLKIPATTP